MNETDAASKPRFAVTTGLAIPPDIAALIETQGWLMRGMMQSNAPDDSAYLWGPPDLDQMTTGFFPKDARFSVAG